MTSLPEILSSVNRSACQCFLYVLKCSLSLTTNVLIVVVVMAAKKSGAVLNPREPTNITVLKVAKCATSLAYYSGFSGNFEVVPFIG